MVVYITFVLIELIVAIPVYYLIRAIVNKRYIEWIALAAIITSIGAGWFSGYRYTKDIMISDYLDLSKRQEIIKYNKNLSQERWAELRDEFLATPQNIQNIHIGAAKIAVPSAIFVAILLFWLAEKTKRKINIKS